MGCISQPCNLLHNRSIDEAIYCKNITQTQCVILAKNTRNEAINFRTLYALTDARFLLITSDAYTNTPVVAVIVWYLCSLADYKYLSSAPPAWVI